MIAIVGAMLMWAYYCVTLTQLADGISIRSFVTITAVLGSVILAPLALVEVIFWRKPTLTAVEVIFITGYLGLFASVIAYLAWTYGVVKLGSNVAAPFMNLVPIFATAFGVTLLDEPFTLRQFFAALLIIVAACLAIREYGKQKLI